MKTFPIALVALAFLGSSRPGCGPYRPERGGEEKKPPKVLAVCNELSGKCYYSCFGREASYACAQCCSQNFLLCNNNEKYSFEPCELIDPAPKPSPDGGTGEAPGKASPP